MAVAVMSRWETGEEGKGSGCPFREGSEAQQRLCCFC